MKEKTCGNRSFPRRDLLLILVLLLIAGAAFAAQHMAAAKPRADAVVVRIDGVEAGRYSLSSDAEIPFDTKYGHNLLVIRDGEAYMTEADCPDGYCMRQRAVSRAGEVIVCLPHRLIAEAVAGGADPEGEGVDGVVR